MNGPRSVPPEGPVRNDSPSAPPPRAPRLALSGIALGAFWGAAEMSWMLLRAGDDSVARRAVWLIAYGAIVCGGLLGAWLGIAGLIARLGGARGWRSAASGGGRLVAALTAAAGLFALLVLRADALLENASPAVGIAVLAIAALLAALLAWLLAARLPERYARRLERAVAILQRPGRCAAIALPVAAALLLLLPALIAPGVPAGPSAGDGTARPDIVLVLIDTLREDALGCYGAPPGSTPVMDRLAAEGVLFERALAPSSWTIPSVVSMLTSAPPHEHGYSDFDGAVAPEVASLPEILSNAGYATFGLAANPLMRAGRGLSRGFGFYDVYSFELEGRLAASRLLSGACRLTGLLGRHGQSENPILWLGPLRPPLRRTALAFQVLDEEINDRLFRYADLSDPRPRFFYIHYFAPHDPYLEHPRRLFSRLPAFTPDNVERLRALYAGEVAYTDRILGELLDGLRETGAARDPIVLVTSDHGEEFHEHGGFKHGRSVFQEVIRVPFILAGGGVPPGKRVSRRVELLDIAPTLLDLAGLPVPDGFRGRSLVPLVRGEEGAYPPRPIHSEVVSRWLNPRKDHRAVIFGNLKLIRVSNLFRGTAREAAYDLAADPGEQRPVETPAGSATGEAADLGRRIDEIERAAQRRPATALSEDELRSLRALGYVR